jgi:hypothetical protein
MTTWHELDGPILAGSPVPGGGDIDIDADVEVKLDAK